ncbi:MAG: pyrroline-5-carboxylate reductase [Xanthomonadales bacterium]
MIITFIGGGNMATALISGLRKSTRNDLKIRVSDPSEEARNRLQAAYEVEPFVNSVAAIAGVDIIVLAIKPQVMTSVLDQLAGNTEPRQLVLSIAAGTTIATIAKALGNDQIVIRSMPNMPALIGHGIAAIYPGENCKPHHIEQAEQILTATGKVVLIQDESLMDVVTAISGSGPAYYFLLTEALADAGHRLGLPGEVADKLAAYTAFGAGAMVIQSDAGVAELRRQVTSPGGTTQAALEALESGAFSQVVRSAVEAATSKSRELAND